MKKFILLFAVVILTQFLCGQTLEEVESQISILKSKIELLNTQIQELNQQLDSLNKLRAELLEKRTIGEDYICLAGTAIYKEPTGYASVGTIQTNSIAKVTNVLEEKYEILFNGVKGYVHKNALTPYKEYIAKKEAATKEKAREEEEARILEQEQAKKRYAAAIERDNQKKSQLIKKYGEKNGLMIFEGKVWIGMTAEMARDSWGYPKDINRTITANLTHEQWVYDNDKYLYFENGILTTIQE